MKVDCRLVLLFLVALASNCRTRLESSQTDNATAETTTFEGRVVVIDIYDKVAQLRRQLPGVLVSSRAVLIAGLKPTETISLADDHRKGEKYFPIKTAKNDATFVGLEPRPAAADNKSDPASADFKLVPTTAESLPPLSAQALRPLAVRSQLGSQWSRVIWYNDMGFIKASAKIDGNGFIRFGQIDWPQGYPKEGFLEALFHWFFQSQQKSTFDLRKEEAQEMIRKGGALISDGGKYRGLKREGIFWRPELKDSNEAATIDIVAYAAEDPLFELPPPGDNGLTRIPNLIRTDLGADALDVAREAVAVKMNVPPDLQRDLLEYLDCKSLQ